MSKRYVIQVCDTITDENAYDVQDVADAVDGQPVTAWFNLPGPDGDVWMSRSKTKTLNHAVNLALQGEARQLRICESRPVYSLTPVPALDVAVAVALVKQISADIEAEVTQYGYGEPGDSNYVAPPLSQLTEDQKNYLNDTENDVAPAAFEVVEDDPNEENAWLPKVPKTEQVEDSHEPEDEGTCCFKHRQDWLQSQL